MGNLWWLYNQECPCCGKIIEEVIFNESEYDENGDLQGYATARCNHCKKVFRIDMEFKLSKLEK